MKDNKELISSVEEKETWEKPELETVSVKESTLNGPFFTPDAVVMS